MQWPSQLLPQWCLTVCSKAWTHSEWGPDSQCCRQPLRVRGHRAVNQRRQVEHCTAAPLAAFSNTFISHDAQSLASYLCHLVILVWVLSGCACGKTISSPFFSFFPSGQAQLHFLWCYQTLCFQNRYSTTWGVKLNSSLPTSSQLKVMRKTIGPGEDVGLPVLPSLPWLRGIRP